MLVGAYVFSPTYLHDDLAIASPTPKGVGDKSQGRGSGFPHSEISGSKGARTSPELIAACHVLLSLPAPRHPSEALMRLIVLNKTHAREKGRRHIDACRNGRFDPRLGISSSPDDVFIYRGRPSKRWRRRVDPSFTMSTQGSQTPFHLRREPLIHANVSFLMIARTSSDGGAGRDRTDDLMLAKHALYQLSYGPHWIRD